MHISSNGHSNHGALLTGRLAHQDVCKSPNVILICWASCSSWAGPAAHHSFRLWSQSCWLYIACMRCPWARLQLDKSCLRYLLSKRQQMAAYAVSAEPACTTRHSTEAMAHNGCPARLDDIATLLMLICRPQDGAQIYAVDCTTINQTTGKSIYVKHTRLRKALVANGGPTSVRHQPLNLLRIQAGDPGMPASLLQAAGQSAKSGRKAPSTSAMVAETSGDQHWALGCTLSWLACGSSRSHVQVSNGWGQPGFVEMPLFEMYAKPMHLLAHRSAEV